MEIQYKRELKRNYLIIEPDWETQAGYEAKMLMENRIEGLLDFHMKYVDDRQIYYYDITSMQPLSRITEGRWISREEVCRLLIQIDAVLNRAREYLLDGDHLLLDADYIYMDPQWEQISFCFVPGLHESFSEALSRLLQYILKKTDHRDKEGVVLVYGLYQESLKENYGLENLLLLIHKDQPGDRENRWEKAEAEDEVLEEQDRNPWPDTVQEVFEEPRRPASPLQMILKIIACCMGALLLVLGAIWMFQGWRGIKTWGIVAAAGCALAAAAALGLELLFKRRDRGKGEEPERMAAEPADLGGQTQEKGFWKEKQKNLWVQELREEKRKEEELPIIPFKTVPLSAGRGQEDVCRLEPENRQQKTIEIRYFPFIIGKQEELVDFCLEDDTVSRLHLRLDREEGECWVTDLNSTNGTTVNGRLLEANESAPLRPGDELVIAALRYHFRSEKL